MPQDRAGLALARVLDGSRPAPDDPSSASAHAEAVADVERIRLALRAIGQEAAKTTPEPETGGRPLRARRLTWLRPVALAAAALTLLLAGLVGISRLGGSPGGSGGGSHGYELYFSCARRIVDGTALSIRAASRPGHLVVTLAVRDWLKPATGPDRADVEVPDPASRGEPPFRTGQREILIVWRDIDRVDRFTGATAEPNRQALLKAQPRATERDRQYCVQAGTG